MKNKTKLSPAARSADYMAHFHYVGRLAGGLMTAATRKLETEVGGSFRSLFSRVKYHARGWTTNLLEGPGGGYEVVLLAESVPFTNIRPHEGGIGLYLRGVHPIPPHAPEENEVTSGIEYTTLGEAVYYAGQLSRDLLGLYGVQHKGRPIAGAVAARAEAEGDRFGRGHRIGPTEYQREFEGAANLLRFIQLDTADAA